MLWPWFHHLVAMDIADPEGGNGVEHWGRFRQDKVGVQEDYYTVMVDNILGVDNFPVVEGVDNLPVGEELGSHPVGDSHSEGMDMLPLGEHSWPVVLAMYPGVGAAGGSPPVVGAAGGIHPAEGVGAAAVFHD